MSLNFSFHANCTLIKSVHRTILQSNYFFKTITFGHSAYVILVGFFLFFFFNIWQTIYHFPFRDMICEINLHVEAVALFAHTYVFTHPSTLCIHSIFYIYIYICVCVCVCVCVRARTYTYTYTHMYTYIFAEFRYNVTCGWFSFVGLSVFDVGCYCWLLGV